MALVQHRPERSVELSPSVRGLTAYRFWQHLCLKNIIIFRTRACDVKTFNLMYEVKYKEKEVINFKFWWNKRKFERYVVWYSSLFIGWSICINIKNFDFMLMEG